MIWSKRIETCDVKLVESAICGDLDSFGTLCGRYYSAMVAVAYCVLHDKHLAEDAVQEAYARALVKLPGLRDAKKFGPWLRRICRNRAIDISRKRLYCANIDDVGQLPATQGDKDGGYVEVHEAISKLPAQAQELLAMRYFSNMTYEQISEVSGLTRAAINSRLNRAKKKLAKILKNSVEVEGWV